jgi:hypothetical protein
VGADCSKYAGNKREGGRKYRAQQLSRPRPLFFSYLKLLSPLYLRPQSASLTTRPCPCLLRRLLPTTRDGSRALLGYAAPVRVVLYRRGEKSRFVWSGHLRDLKALNATGFGRMGSQWTRASDKCPIWIPQVGNASMRRNDGPLWHSRPANPHRATRQTVVGWPIETAGSVKRRRSCRRLIQVDLLSRDIESEDNHDKSNKE